MATTATTTPAPEPFTGLLPRLHRDSVSCYHLDSSCVHAGQTTVVEILSSFELDMSTLCHHCGADRAAPTMKKKIDAISQLERLRRDLVNMDINELGWLKIATMQSGVRLLRPLTTGSDTDVAAAAARLSAALTAEVSRYRESTTVDLTLWRDAALLVSDPLRTFSGALATHLAALTYGGPGGRADYWVGESLREHLRENVVTDLRSGSTWDQAVAAARKIELARAELSGTGPADRLEAAVDGILTLWRERLDEWAAEHVEDRDRLVLATGVEELSKSYLTGFTMLLAPARHTAESDSCDTVLAVVPSFVWAAMQDTEINSRDAGWHCLGDAEAEDAEHLAMMLRLHIECPALTLDDLRTASRAVSATFA